MLIAVTSVSSIMENTRRNSFKSDVQILITSIDTNYIQNSLGISTKNYQTIETNMLGNKIYLIVQGQNNYRNLLAYGTYDSMSITDDTNYSTIKSELVYDFFNDVNAPQLSTGMTPVKWNGSNWIATTESDPDWYDYANKKWANVKTADGSMWVWIPRYIYKISSGWHNSSTGTIEVQFSKGIDDNWNYSVIGNISSDTSSNASNNKWTNHPAFTFGNDELTGIWVAKFEASSVEGNANGYVADYSCPSTLDNVITKTVKIVPNVPSWRCIQVGNIFTVVRNMETKSIYGWNVASNLQANGSFLTDGNGVDVHQMKNTEWGAVVYLSKSVNYGQGTNEVWINNSNEYTTGCAGNSVTDAASTGCINAYNTTNGVKSSTTGTIYGIYDMSGGAWEYVAAYVDNANVNLNEGTSIINASNKYKDVYPMGTTDDQVNNYSAAINKKGDAVYETSNNSGGVYAWFTSHAYIPYTNNPFFVRSGRFNYGDNVGTFLFRAIWGGVYSGNGFRPVVVVKAGL